MRMFVLFGASWGIINEELRRLTPWTRLVMTLDIPLSPKAEATLRKQAHEAGLSAEAIAARLLERSLARIPDLTEISGPIYEAFKASGMTEDELAELLEREKHAMRAERRANKP